MVKGHIGTVQLRILLRQEKVYEKVSKFKMPFLYRI